MGTAAQIARDSDGSGDDAGRKKHGVGNRIFISYKRSVDPDESVALKVFQELQDYADPFIDRTITVGSLWAHRIEEELKQADFLIVFLSAHSVQSEMVQGEVEMAYRMAKQTGKPAILPVRVNYRDPFQYPLSAYLNSIQWAEWNNDNDMAVLLDQLAKAIRGDDLDPTTPPVAPQTASDDLHPPAACAQPRVNRNLEAPEGTMDPESRLYVEREADEVAAQTLSGSGVTLTIKGARQMGKSSLLVRALRNAPEQTRKVFLDFQLFDHASLADPDRFYRQFCAWLTEELELEDKVAEYFDPPLSNSQRASRYLQRHVLRSIQEPLLLAIDEADSLLETSFSADFFGMLRSWHNARATSAAWKRLNLALVISTEPYQLISDLNQSPFNVGQVVELDDFAPEQVEDLARRHGSPFSDAEVHRLIELLGGHPFLVRRALYLTAAGQMEPPEMFEQAADDRGPFGDHLRHHMFRLQRAPALIACFRQILESQSCHDELHFFRLRGAGLVRREGRKVVPRCQLYQQYFQDRLNV